MRHRCTVVFAGVLASLPSFAQQEAEERPVQAQTQTQTQRLERVEVQGKPLPETELRRRQSVAKQIYGREDLDRYGDTQLSDVLKRLPGINISDGQLRVRGLGGAYTQILVNGEPAPPDFNLDDVNPAQVERLEISKATTSDLSAQAIAGTLNIILKEAPSAVQKDLRLGIGYNGERPEANGRYTYGNRFGDTGLVVPLLVYQTHRSERTRTLRYTPSQPLPDGTRERVSDGQGVRSKRGVNISPRVNWRLGDKQSLSLQGFFVKNRVRNQRLDQLQVDLVDPALADRAFTETRLNRGSFGASRLSLKYASEADLGRKLELRALAGRSDQDSDVNVQSTNEQRRRLSNGRNGNAILGGKYSQHVGTSHTLTAGIDLEHRSRDEQRLTISNGAELLPGFDGVPFTASTQRAAAFAQDEWLIDQRWSAYLGLRNEWVRLRSDGRGSALTSRSSVFTPSIHLNRKFGADGRDLIRASVTRSYKLPDVQQLIARPAISDDYPASGTNSDTAPDRIGNPNLKPELATGLDLAWESYLAGGGVVSLGVFHRRINGLIRNELRFRRVAWSDNLRWVAMPVNLGRATTSGAELEVKGGANEWLPALFDAGTALNLRASVSVYHSQVEGIPGPNSRLEQQQPWSVSLGADYRFKAAPLRLGFNAQYTPSFEVQQSALQRLLTEPSRGVDAFALWNIGSNDSVRFSANNLWQAPNRTTTLFDNGDFSLSERQTAAAYTVNWERKF